MKKIFNIRNIVAEDYDIINTWWSGNGHKDSPQLSFLPENGLGGIIIEKEKPIAAGYVYLTNSDIGYIDFLITNPNYKGRDRYKIILLLIDACYEHAVSLGCKMVWCMTDSKGIIKRSKELGYTVSETKYTVITN